MFASERTFIQILFSSVMRRRPIISEIFTLILYEKRSYLFIWRESVSELRGGGLQREREKQSPLSRKPKVGLDPMTLRS